MSTKVHLLDCCGQLELMWLLIYEWVDLRLCGLTFSARIFSRMDTSLISRPSRVNCHSKEMTMLPLTT